MATMAPPIAREHAFFARMSLVLALFILFGFLQFAARGFVDYRAVPVVFHLHGIAMTTWLGLTVVQSALADRGSLALHRRLGWTSLGLVPVIVVLASVTCLTSLRIHMFPPFFTPAYFLALVHITALAFAGLVAMAIARRRDTGWHKRLIIGALALIMEPALGRLLPMPLMNGWGDWTAMLIQLVPLAVMARHDGRRLGHVHPATLVSALVLVLTHVLVTLAAMLPPVQALAGHFTA
jgi:hypothetical protein